MVQLDRWPAPTHYNSPAAFDSIGSVAAPLLAGFSITLLGFALTSAKELRWPGLVVLFATVTIVLLLTTVQLAAWAKRFVSSPADVRNWFDDVDEPQRRSVLVGELRADALEYKRYSNAGRVAYDISITLLFLTLSVAAAPLSSSGQQSLRWVSAAIAFAAAVSEAAVSLATIRKGRR